MNLRTRTSEGSLAASMWKVQINLSIALELFISIDEYVNASQVLTTEAIANLARIRKFKQLADR